MGTKDNEAIAETHHRLKTQVVCLWLQVGTMHRSVSSIRAERSVFWDLLLCEDKDMALT